MVPIAGCWILCLGRRVFQKYSDVAGVSDKSSWGWLQRCRNTFSMVAVRVAAHCCWFQMPQYYFPIRP